MNKRLRKKVHRMYIEDVALDISISKVWRNKLSKSEYDEAFTLSVETKNELPKYLKSLFIRYKLRYDICKVKNCPEPFDEGLVIFKIKSKEFNTLVRYSGNNIIME
ncbi:hypothetical protein [Clostridium sp. C8-1-8]|uniref:hypothetical protein n=1 Tax=Clostridium sp. C8-1-8 TaxID=2698831 RepID=UPI001370426C|nr:hypothetical protein [Clostridium sp. C8-1-8]